MVLGAALLVVGLVGQFMFTWFFFPDCIGEIETNGIHQLIKRMESPVACTRGWMGWNGEWYRWSYDVTLCIHHLSLFRTVVSGAVIHPCCCFYQFSGNLEQSWAGNRLLS
jgi:hypothetical protein